MIRDETAFQAQAALESIAATASAAATPVVDQETIKRDLQSQKVRTENRERKKRWREQNEDRNKDNDLRCRVNKRANKLFGKQESEHKTRWIEEEFGKRQMKRKDKERRRNPNASGSVEPVTVATPVKPTPSLSEQLALHHQAQQQQQQLQASQLAHPQFDPTTVKTALALNDLVKKNGNHLDLAQLTGVLTDPNLARQLIEIEASNPAPPVTGTMMVMNTSSKPADHDIKGSHTVEADYPMDAVLTLMQLNGSWKA
ncbi:hypothetical protein BGZ51_000174 [Haplosporangium sp. Z 767]|nr:hypothetical protein BGZ51_000174 [Haplosporangium sp. Z 767]KAF9191217.1 hypothetical protein BGZ50_009563 [Haplosporangium sp. Z 11]